METADAILLQNLRVRHLQLMKQLLFFVIVSFPYLPYMSQQEDEMAKTWSETKATFFKKGDEAKKLAIIAMDSKKARPDDVNRAFGNATRVMYSSKEDVKLDSTHFYGLSRVNDSLDVSMKILLNQLDNDKEFALLKSYSLFKKYYEAADKAIYAAKYRFNVAAQEFEIPYWFTAVDTTQPEVKF